MLLKIGSTGHNVKELQEFLELHADGIFGRGTHQAVKNWQSNNDLVVDGIVGPATWDAMQLATTDESERVRSNFTLNQHFLPKGEYLEGPTEKEYIFIHHTAGWHNPYNTVNNWGRDNRGRVATEFIIGGPSVRGNDDKYDGEIVQAFPEGGYGWHLGRNGSSYMHSHSVGIEVNNFGWIKDGKTYAGTRVDSSQIVTLDQAFRGHKTWHRYSDTQIYSLRELILYIGDRDNIDIRKGLPNLVKQKGAKAFEFNEDAYNAKQFGLWSHTSVRKDKFDCFPQEELVNMLKDL